MKKLIWLLLLLPALALADNMNHVVTGAIDTVQLNSFHESGGCTILVSKAVTTRNCTSKWFSLNCNGDKSFKARPVDIKMANRMLDQAQILSVLKLPVSMVVYDGLVYTGGICVVKSIDLVGNPTLE